MERKKKPTRIRVRNEMKWNSGGTRQWCIVNVPLRWRIVLLPAFWNENFNAKHEEFCIFFCFWTKQKGNLNISIPWLPLYWWSMFHLIILWKVITNPEYLFAFDREPGTGYYKIFEKLKIDTKWFWHEKQFKQYYNIKRH